jgi:hypothetical protein
LVYLTDDVTVIDTYMVSRPSDLRDNLLKVVFIRVFDDCELTDTVLFVCNCSPAPLRLSKSSS